MPVCVGPGGVGAAVVDVETTLEVFEVELPVVVTVLVVDNALELVELVLKVEVKLELPDPVVVFPKFEPAWRSGVRQNTEASGVFLLDSATASL
jgi:hypothetical protein